MKTNVFTKGLTSAFAVSAAFFMWSCGSEPEFSQLPTEKSVTKTPDKGDVSLFVDPTTVTDNTGTTLVVDPLDIDDSAIDECHSRHCGKDYERFIVEAYAYQPKVTKASEVTPTIATDTVLLIIKSKEKLSAVYVAMSNESINYFRVPLKNCHENGDFDEEECGRDESINTLYEASLIGGYDYTPDFWEPYHHRYHRYMVKVSAKEGVHYSFHLRCYGELYRSYWRDGVEVRYTEKDVVEVERPEECEEGVAAYIK